MAGMRERIESEARAGMRVTISMLMCKDCKHRLDDSEIYGNTTQCRKYPEHSKPNQVLKGGLCIRYERGDPYGD